MAGPIHNPHSSSSAHGGPVPSTTDRLAGGHRGRFVVLRHERPGADHWDLMFECEGALATWRSPCALSEVGPDATPLTRIGEHRLAYLDYEGPVSGGRGRVKRHERGDFQREPVRSDHWRIDVRGERTHGTFQLWRAGDHPADWFIARLTEACRDS